MAGAAVGPRKTRLALSRPLTPGSLPFPEFGETDTELSEDLVKKRRPNLLATVDRDRDRPPIRMNPALVTSTLPAPFKTKPLGSAPKLLSAGARHSRSRCCPPA